MREILLLRAARSLFDSDAEVDRLVEFSGGHPRELLRLLKLCCEVADDRIDASVVRTAVDIHPAHGGNDARAQDLLHRLALPQHNDPWRRGSGGWRGRGPIEQASLAEARHLPGACHDDVSPPYPHPASWTGVSVAAGGRAR